MVHLTTLSIADHIPEDLRDPFYTDQYDQEHIKPPVIRLLLSCELYCRVCALILKTEQAASLQSHLSVIQALSRKGIYVVESDDTPVTDEDLACVPIKRVSGWTKGWEWPEKSMGILIDVLTCKLQFFHSLCTLTGHFQHEKVHNSDMIILLLISDTQ